MALPIGQQILLDVIVPPILAELWWLFSRGWANIVQGGDVSEMTKSRQSKGVWVMLAILYLLMFGTTAYYKFVA